MLPCIRGRFSLFETASKVFVRHKPDKLLEHDHTEAVPQRDGVRIIAEVQAAVDE